MGPPSAGTLKFVKENWNTGYFVNFLQSINYMLYILCKLQLQLNRYV